MYPDNPGRTKKTLEHRTSLIRKESNLGKNINSSDTDFVPNFGH